MPGFALQDSESVSQQFTMKQHEPTRRDFLKTGVAGLTALALPAHAEAAPFEVEEITVAELQAKMKTGALTARRLVEIYTERIREIDPKLKSVLEINPDALALAEQLDKERKRGRMRSPLHGIPVLIKDNLDTADKMKTTAGSLALMDAPAPERDAFVVKRLRDAGAVILGKTNLSEWANFRGSRSISGWSGRGGQTNNPYILDKNPCGSSSGTGVAISANLAAVGIGTETNGSIICPAVTNGLVGLKPTLGLVSRSGIIPIAHTQDTAGPMTRTVADAAALLSAIVGYDKSDDITRDAAKGARDYAKFLDKNGLRGARIGVARQFLGNNAARKALWEAQFEVLKGLGATLVDITFSDEIGKLGDARLNVLLYEFKTDLNKYLAGRRAPYRTLADLIKFNEDNKEKELPLFGQELFIQAQAKGELTDAAYLDALKKIKSATRENGIDAALAKDKLDAIVGPAVGATWSIAAVAGYPYITVPAGFFEGLPIGIGFFGRAFSEPSLIKYAYAYEQQAKARRKPEYLPKSG
jgi:amidase